MITDGVAARPRQDGPSSSGPAARDRAWLLRDTALAPLLVLAAMLAWTRTAGVDDAYISYRYAANLNAGHGLVFNPGERVEGVSNTLWTVLLAALERCGLPLPTAGTVLGMLCLAATVVLTRRVALRLGASPWVAVAAAVGVAATVDVVAASTMGLEGALFAGLLLAALLAWRRPGVWSAVGLGLCAVALSATRPEGVVLAGVLAAAALVDRARPVRARVVTAAAAVVGAVVALAARLAYYGHLMPNTVTAKSDGDPITLTRVVGHAARGAAYIVSGLAGPLLVLLLAAVAAAVLVRRYGAPRLVEWPPLMVPAVALLAAGLALPLLSGGDWMPHTRLLAPYLPLGYAAVAAAASMVAVRGGRVWMVAAALLPLLLAVAGPHELPLRDNGGRDVGFDQYGRALAAADLDGRPVVTDVLGRMSYWAPNLRVVDSAGLTEPAVAAAPVPGGLYGKRNWPYIASVTPAVFVSNTWTADRDFLAAGPPIGYVAVLSGRDLAARRFVLVDPAVADRLLGVLDDPTARLVAPSEALAVWEQAAPAGQ